MPLMAIFRGIKNGFYLTSFTIKMYQNNVCITMQWNSLQKYLLSYKETVPQNENKNSI
jgi:hypothetical protein